MYFFRYSPLANKLSYTIFGATLLEVEVDILTGEHKVYIYTHKMVEVSGPILFEESHSSSKLLKMLYMRIASD